MQLFAVCTNISLGDGRIPIFHWVMEENDVFGNRWLQGLAPADIVPDLAKLARHKLLTVA
jgi:hypothetical protein